MEIRKKTAGWENRESDGVGKERDNERRRGKRVGVRDCVFRFNN